MSIKTWPQNERPREKLLSHGASHLSDAELLAIFLRTGIKGISALDLARNLLKQFGNLQNILNASPNEFCKKPGLGIAKYVQLQAVLEISRRYLFETIQGKNALHNSTATKHYLRIKLGNRTQETFACLLLNNQHDILAFYELWNGSISHTHVYPREIAKIALEHHASAIIFAHNHPSGDPKPSSADIELTQQLKQALALIDIHVLDHIIIGHNTALSFLEIGLL